jgi:hypothetical protein
MANCHAIAWKTWKRPRQLPRWMMAGLWRWLLKLAGNQFDRETGAG